MRLRCSKIEPARLVRYFEYRQRFSKSSWSQTGYELFLDDKGRQCLSMELMENSLHKVRQTGQGLTVEEVFKFGIEMIDAINELHNVHGVVHGDLEARNWQLFNDRIILTEYGYMKGNINPDEKRLKLLLELQQLVATLNFFLSDFSCFSFSAMKENLVNLVYRNDVVLDTLYTDIRDMITDKYLSSSNHTK